MITKRPLLAPAIAGENEKLQEMLTIEEKCERERDRDYWLPLKKELESLRHAR